MAPVNVENLNSEEFKKFLDSFDHVFSDCDGVIWLSTKALPGVAAFFELMKNNGKTLHYVSNNSMRSKEQYMKMFDRAGIPGGFEKLTIPSRAIAEYLKFIHFDKHVYCVTCPEAKKMIESYGLKTKYGPDACPENYSDYKDFLIDDPDIGAVVFDGDYKVNMPKLYKASTYLKRPEVLFFNGATDKYMAFSNGLAIGVSHFPQIVAEMVNRQPLTLGKPSKDFGLLAMRRAGVTNASRVLFIGDMIAQDVSLGKNTGFKTMLVLTNTTEEEMRTTDIKPDFYARSLGSIVPRFKQ